MLNPRDMVAYLRENGFHFVRRTKHGHLYSDNISRILVPGTPGDHRSLKNTRSEVRRALKKREEVLGRPVLEALPKEEIEAMNGFTDVTREPKRVVVQPKLATLGDVMGKIIITGEKKVEEEKETPVETKEEKVDRRTLRTGTRYSDEDKEKLHTRITQLFDIGCMHIEIADKLNEEGYTNSQGQPMTVGNVSQICRALNLRRRASPARITQVDPVAERVRSLAANIPAPPKAPEPMSTPEDPNVTRSYVNPDSPADVRVATERRKEVAAAAAPRGDEILISRDELLSILTHPKFSAEKKVRLILAFLEE